MGQATGSERVDCGIGERSRMVKDGEWTSLSARASRSDDE